MTVRELMRELAKIPPDVNVKLQVREPYDEDPITLTETARTIRFVPANFVVIISDGKSPGDRYADPHR